MILDVAIDKIRCIIFILFEKVSSNSLLIQSSLKLKLLAQNVVFACDTTEGTT